MAPSVRTPHTRLPKETSQQEAEAPSADPQRGKHNKAYDPENALVTQIVRMVLLIQKTKIFDAMFARKLLIQQDDEQIFAGFTTEDKFETYIRKGVDKFRHNFFHLILKNKYRQNKEHTNNNERYFCKNRYLCARCKQDYED